MTEKWTILQQQPSPGLRFDHSSAARPAMHEIYVFGGTILTMSILGANYTQTNDLWKLDTVAEKWSQVQVATPVAPIPRSEATAVAVGNDSLVVFGGVVVPTTNSYPIDLSDLWSFSYDAKTWTQLGPTNKLVAPLTRFSHASTTLTVNGVLYVAVFSGRHITNDGWTSLNDAWMTSHKSGQSSTLSSIMFLLVAFLVLFFTSIFLIAYMYRRYRWHNVEPSWRY
ncbi:unnamed protein product [Aphanomyces euteiches]